MVPLDEYDQYSDASMSHLVRHSPYIVPHSIANVTVTREMSSYYQATEQSLSVRLFVHFHTDGIHRLDI